MMKKAHNMLRGFSLIEMIIYVGILSIIMVLVVQTVLGIVSAYSQLTLIRNVESNATVSLDRLIREIQTADSVDSGQSTFDSHPGRLVLNTTTVDGDPSTLDFYIVNGVMHLREGSTYLGPLTSSSTVITNIVYRLLATTTQAVKIDMTLESSKGSTTKSSSFHSTAILRGGY